MEEGILPPPRVPPSGPVPRRWRGGDQAGQRGGKRPGGPSAKRSVAERDASAVRLDDAM